MRLVDAELETARQGDAARRAPPALRERLARDRLRGHLVDERVDVVADEVQLVLAGRGRIRLVHRELGGRQAEDQKALAGIDVRKLEDVAKERRIRSGVRGHDEDVGTGQHGPSLPRTRGVAIGSRRI